jgi:photosystem II stability/assembly factor-like uncharacterized protein
VIRQTARWILAFPLVLLLATAAVPALAADPGWTPIGPFGGTANAIVPDPGNAAIVYALIAGGERVYKSVDHGASWSAITQGLPRDAGAAALAIDPRRPRTLYLAMAGVYKSTDGGASWVSLNLNASVSSLAVDPGSPGSGSTGTIYAGTGSGVFKTTDGGAHWTPRNHGLPLAPAPPVINDLAVDPLHPGVAYAIVNDFTLFKTADGGATWKRQPLKLPVGEPIQTLAIDPRQPANVLAATYACLFKSTNGGGSWALSTTGLPKIVVTALAFDPRSPRTVYAGTLSSARDFRGNGVFRSDDGGATWSPVDAGLSDLRIRALAVGPQGTVYAGTQNDALPGGIFQSGDGRTWQRTVRGLSAQEVAAVAVQPSSGVGPAILWAGAPNGLFRSPNGGGVWKPLPVDGRIDDVQSIVVDPRPPGTTYALSTDEEFTQHLSKTTDAGRTWTPLTYPKGQGSNRLRRDPHTGTLWLVGAILARSDDGGATWKNGIAKGSGADLFTDIAFDPSAPNVLYAGGLVQIPGLGPDEPRLFKSLDGGASWTRIDSEEGGTPIPDRLLVSPVSSAVVYATAGPGLYRSDDAGLHWAQAAEAPQGGQIDDLLAAPDGTLYAATSNSGVYTSSDGLAWTALDPTGLESLDILALALDPARPDLLYAGTGNSGIETHTAPR